MRQRHIVSTHRTTAPVDQVWELLENVDRWSEWAPVRSAEVERPGFGNPNGVGTIRALRTPTGLTREEVVVFEPPHHQRYVLLSGPPLEAYRGDVWLTEHPGGGTVIRWESKFSSTFPWYLLISAAIRTYTRRLAAAAAREARTRVTQAA